MKILLFNTDIQIKPITNNAITAFEKNLLYSTFNSTNNDKRFLLYKIFNLKLLFSSSFYYQITSMERSFYISFDSSF